MTSLTNRGGVGETSPGARTERVPSRTWANGSAITASTNVNRAFYDPLETRKRHPTKINTVARASTDAGSGVEVTPALNWISVIG